MKQVYFRFIAKDAYLRNIFMKCQENVTFKRVICPCVLILVVLYCVNQSINLSLASSDLKLKFNDVFL